MSTKECVQCHKIGYKDQFSKNQWRKPSPSCRRCTEFTKISQETSRRCHGCRLVLHRTKFDVYQWGRGNEALCPSRIGEVEENFRSSLASLAVGGAEEDNTKELADGIIVCRKHSLERCDICKMDFTLPNDFARKRKEVGREDLTEEELDQVEKEWRLQNNVHINRKVCIMDGRAFCPRTSRKLRCPCNEVTYCSEVCQKHHWKIHKMTCKHHAKKMQKKEKKKSKRQEAVNDLTEEQKDFVRKEAFFAENSGREHSIEECAWQLGEHPLVIGGGSVRYGADGEGFEKGDVAKIYRENMGVEWDGTPRFGMGPYVQRKPKEDWIKKAREGKSQRVKDLEQELGLRNF